MWSCGVIAEPEVTELQITPDDHIVLLCSDGVWEFIRPDEAVRLVSEYSPLQAMVAVERLAKEAWDRWILEESSSVVDDITIVLVYLHAGRDEGCLQNPLTFHKCATRADRRAGGRIPSTTI